MNPWDLLSTSENVTQQTDTRLIGSGGVFASINPGLLLVAGLVAGYALARFAR